MLIYSDLNWIQQQSRLVGWAQAGGHRFEDVTKIGHEQGVLVTSEAEVAGLRLLSQNRSILAMLPIRIDHIDEDIERTILYIDNLDPKKQSFVLSNHQQGQEYFQFEIAKSEERWKLIEQLGDYASSKPVFETFPDMARTIASELLTNAFYNAPQDDSGRPIQPNRGADVSIHPPRYVNFSYGDDGNHLWMKISDPFGTFNREKLLKQLVNCASKDKLVVSQGVGGAGIGLFMVFRWATQLLFVFEPGHETFVFVKLLKTKRMRVFDSQRAIFEVIERPRS